jgi:hypothetical protein
VCVFVTCENCFAGNSAIMHTLERPGRVAICRTFARASHLTLQLKTFLIFHLQRPDVLPVGDLGVRNAAKQVYGLDELPKPAELEAIGEPWRPYRSLASLYLWRSLDNVPD